MEQETGKLQIGSMPNSAMSSNAPASGDKWRWSLYIGLIFLIVANPYTYTLVNKILGSLIPIANNGCPTPAGFIIHAVVLVLLVRLLMNYKL